MDFNMRFIHKWSYCSARYLTNALNQGHAQRRVYDYGFLIVYGAIVKGVLLFGSALLLRTLIPTLILTVTFAALRTQAGGYHMDTYGKCILTSLAMFLFCGLIAKYFPVNGEIPAEILIGIYGIYGIVRYAPKDTPNKPITAEEAPKFRRMSIIFSIAILAISAVLLYFGYYSYSLAMMFGYGLEVFSITPIGHRFFDWIAGKKTEY